MPRLRQNAAGLPLLLAALAVAGCTGPQRVFDEVAYAWEAKRAYEATAAPGAVPEVSRHYERGWRKGYTAVALGRDACPPAVPPHAYLGKKYQCAEGRELVRLWYRGYADGVTAARVCCLGPQVVTNGADCNPCRAACLSPVGGVLPEPHLAMATQAGRDPRPMPTYAEPAFPRTSPSKSEPRPAAERVPPPERTDTPAGGLEEITPERTTAQKPATEADDIADPPADAADEGDGLGYTPSETTPIVFPAGDAPAVEGSELIDAEPLPPALGPAAADQPLFSPPSN